MGRSEALLLRAQSRTSSWSVAACCLILCWFLIFSNDFNDVAAQQGLPSGQCVPFQLPSQFGDYKAICDYLKTIPETEVKARFDSVLTASTPSTEGGRPLAGCTVGCPLSDSVANDISEFFLAGWTGKCFSNFQNGLPATVRNIISPGASSRDSWASGVDGTLMYEGVVSSGPSWSGTGDALLLDYPEEIQEPGIIDFSDFRDELREVAPGMTIGQIWNKPGTSSNPLGTPTPGAWFALFQVCTTSGTYATQPGQRVMTKPAPVPVGGGAAPVPDLSAMMAGMGLPSFPEGFGPTGLPDFLGAFGGGAESAADGELPFSGLYSDYYASAAPYETDYVGGGGDFFSYGEGGGYPYQQEGPPAYFDGIGGTYGTAPGGYDDYSFYPVQGAEYYSGGGDVYPYGGGEGRYFSGGGPYFDGGGAVDYGTGYGYFAPGEGYSYGPPAGDVYDGGGGGFPGGPYFDGGPGVGGGFPAFGGGADGFPAFEGGGGFPVAGDFGDFGDFGGGPGGGGFPVDGDFGGFGGFGGGAGGGFGGGFPDFGGAGGFP